jgi:hypothetical protein
MPTNYGDIIMYLDAIGANANNDPGGAPHHYWWHVNHDSGQPPLAYKDFVTGTIFGEGVPIIGTDSKQSNPLMSMFYLLLSTKGGTGGFNQMPWKGPYVTDAGFSVTLSNGNTITGADIMANMKEWLGNGYPDVSANSPDPDTSA